ncbi:Adenosylmethionine-8-amino-7-oxononanoate aminotransferase [Desulfotomaculum arcticum]|uniref:Adenosylmethionine-8-amino-7-oxononanoate aminotransferase n=1 Tax=Desulfotruncus arcticus DSM 17038 TaxID=1121424 RepID=A0A1I2TMG3_9FIRM|nr:aspartate aminotransferase family protein [Desulfotruncus arcticus]SFG66013.1 Adenosylmethionine-8-amino-7-oxononanoate aminotransferase [Desulfotomaculum arcticum] [Desulfotruncus arcticus DSM 17038]
MYQSGEKLAAATNLILHRTGQKEIQEGITVIVKGEGVWVYDQDGTQYLDMDSGVTRPVHAGYGREELARAAYDQMCQLAYFTPMQFANVPAIKLSEKLAQIAPGEINNFTFECDGSEAVETAMKLARHYHYYRGDKARFKIISRRGAYHGVNGIGIRALGTVMPMRQMMEPLTPGSVFIESPYCYRCPCNLKYPECEIACARDLSRIIEFEGPEYISVFIGEPIQQGFGAFKPPKEYWQIIREICDKYGILLIMDEVICGFGRTGKMFATEHFNIQPDLITMAKGITSGYVPLGAVGCTGKVLEPIDIFNHLHTYGNHPVPCAVGLENIDIIIREKLVENSAEMGKYFLEALKPLEQHPSVGEVRGTGLWLAVDFTMDKKTRAPYPVANLLNMVARAKQKGAIIKMMGMALEFAPPLIIKKEEIDLAVKVIEQCITEEEKALNLT